MTWPEAFAAVGGLAAILTWLGWVAYLTARRTGEDRPPAPPLLRWPWPMPTTTPPPREQPPKPLENT